MLASLSSSYTYNSFVFVCIFWFFFLSAQLYIWHVYRHTVSFSLLLLFFACVVHRPATAELQRRESLKLKCQTANPTARLAHTQKQPHDGILLPTRNLVRHLNNCIRPPPPPHPQWDSEETHPMKLREGTFANCFTCRCLLVCLSVTNKHIRTLNTY